MVLTVKTWLEQVEKLFGSTEIVAKGVADIESIIGLIVLISSILAAGWKAFISICTILSSYNIEIALMTKKERVKMNATSIAVFAIALWIFNLLCSHMVVIYGVNDGMILGGGILMFAFLVALVVIIVLLFVAWLAKKISDIHLCRFLGVIAKRILLVVGRGIYRTTAWVRGKCINIVNKIKNIGIFVCIKNFYIRCRNWFMEIWRSCKREKTENNFQKLTFIQQLRLSGVVIILMLGIIFNMMVAQAKGDQNVYVVSTMITIMMLEVGMFFLNFQVSPQDSRIYYYDNTWGKFVFIYFRQDESHCIGGDKDILGDCNELFLVPYEKIAMQKLYSISKWEKQSYIDSKRIRLQHGHNELLMDEVYDKVNENFKSKGTAPELLVTADIYIKPDTRKAYYVLADGTKGDIDL